MDNFNLKGFINENNLGAYSKLEGQKRDVDGDGDIDFERLAIILSEECPKASFIPEIWQGHKNGGESFWLALERLEGKI